MRTRNDLRQMQALPLELKIRLTQSRIRQWVDEYGEDGVYISFSGGKDSTVLLHIARELYPDIPAVFVNTGLEYPEIVQFVKTFDNVEIIRPKMNFKKVIEKYGYPFISKEVAERVFYGQAFAKKYGYTEATQEFFDHIKTLKHGGFKLKQLCGFSTNKSGGRTIYTFQKWVWLSFAPFKISNLCCKIMKKIRRTTTKRKQAERQLRDKWQKKVNRALLTGCSTVATALK